MMDPQPALLRLDAVDIAAANRILVSQLDLGVFAGDRLAIIGRNGAGKSLTLRTMAGLVRPRAGRISLGGVDIDGLDRRSIAQRLALLPQETVHDFPELALERTLSGRHPHIGRWQWESRRDIEIARGALAAMGIAELAERDTATLSGGEQQRLALAQVIAQQPGLFLLDEPTNHLDLRHQHRVLDHFQQLAARGAAVVLSLHDVNLAARFAERVLLLFGDGHWILGRASEALTEANLTRLLDVPIRRLSVEHDRSLFVAAPDG